MFRNDRSLQDTKSAFAAIRRMLRVAKRNPMQPEPYFAAVSAMRAFTGHWDTCEPLTFQQRRGEYRRGTIVLRQPVYASCTRWIRSH